MRERERQAGAEPGAPYSPLLSACSVNESNRNRPRAGRACTSRPRKLNSCLCYSLPWRAEETASLVTGWPFPCHAASTWPSTVRRTRNLRPRASLPTAVPNPAAVVTRLGSILSFVVFFEAEIAQSDAGRRPPQPWHPVVTGDLARFATSARDVESIIPAPRSRNLVDAVMRESLTELAEQFVAARIGWSPGNDQELA